MRRKKPRFKRAAQAAVQAAGRVRPTLAEPAYGRSEAPKAEASPRETERRLPFKIPPILLEGDGPRSAAAASPETPIPPSAPAASPRNPEATQLPEAYGTGRLSLVARDPHWLYAHWDLTPQQQREYNARSADRHLVVRIQPGTLAGHPVTELHVHPESRSWFIHVERPATRYSAELGYHPTRDQWVTVATATPVATPPDTVSADKTLRFATVPPEVPLRELATSDKQMRRAERPPAGAQQERVLEAVFRRYRILQEPPSSIGIPELIRGPFQGEHLHLLPLLPAAPVAPAEAVSSPLGGEAPRPKGFWLNLNAELVLYGATAPDARVSISDQPIQLRPDGTFSCRFALPDGDYTVGVSARSTEDECRQATLKFSRRTEHQSDVGTAPPDPSLVPLPSSNP